MTSNKPLRFFVLLMFLLSVAGALGQSAGQSNPETTNPTITTVVGGGTTNFIPIWTNSSTLGNSTIFQNSSLNVGLGTQFPTDKLDVAGSGNFRGRLRLATSGTATASKAFPSQPLDLNGASFNSTFGISLIQAFRLQVVPLNNNTANASGKLILAFGQGAATPLPTGLEFAANGQIHFAAGQKFPGTGTVSSVGSGQGLLGGPIHTTGTLSLDTTFTDGRYAQLAVTNNFAASQNITGNLAATGNVSASGAVNGSVGAFTGNLGVGGNVTAGGAVNGSTGAFTGNLGVGGNLGVVNVNATGLVNGAGGALNGAVGIGLTSQPGNKLNVTGGSMGLGTLGGGLWFQTQNMGSQCSTIIFGGGCFHMFIAADQTATKTESLGIFACNQGQGAFTDATTGNICRITALLFGSPFEAFRFQSNGNAFAAVAWTAGGVDLAEKYPNFAPGLSAGDVVVLDKSSKDVRLVASSAPYDENILGVISERPGVVLGGSGEELKDAEGIPLALSGRVPVKVTLENGPIHVGDYLTASSQPGYAMRASKSGRVIGIALTSFGGASDPLSTSGKLIVFVNAHHWENGEEMHQLRAEIELLKGELAARDQQVRELRSEFNQFRQALGVQRAAVVQP